MAECDILDPSVIFKYLNGPLIKGGRKNIPGTSRPYTIKEEVCCWEAPSQTYNDFITGVTQTYNEMCLRDRTWSGYITKLFKSCLSGGTGGASGATIYVTGGTAVVGTSTLTFTNSSGGTFNVSNGNVLFNDAFVSGGTLDAGTGCVTFRNTSGGTFQVCGFDGFTSYWSANTFGISNSGLTNENVGIGTSTPNKPLTVVGDISGTTALYLGRDDIFISGETQVNGDLSIHSGDDIELYAGDDIVFNTDCRIKFTELNSQSPSLEFELDNGPGIAFIQNGQENTVIAITSADTRLYFNDIGGEYIVGDGTNLTIAAGTDIFLNGDVNVSGFLGVTGKTYLGTIDPAGGGYTADKILVAQNGGEVEYLTIAQLKDDIADADYWSGNTDGSISNSGLTTTKVGIGSNTPTHKLHVKGNSASDDPVKLETVQAGRGYVLVIDDAGVVYKSKSTSGTISASTLEVTGDVKASGKLTGATLDISGNADIDGTITGNLTGEVTGNASTATILATTRTIGGVGFNGSSNINLPGVNTSGNQDTSGTAAEATILETARNIGGVSFNGSANINLPGVNTTGNQNTSGNAATATILATARNIGGVSFNGSANIDLPGVNTSGNQNTSGTAAIATTVTVTDNESTNENNVIAFVAGAAGSGNVGLEADGNLTYNPSTGKVTATGFVGDVTGNITGNAATATALETARNIGGVSFDGTANINLPGVNTAGNQDTSGNASTATKIASITNSDIVQLTDNQTLTNKTLTSPVLNTGISGSAFLDEDDMASDSATKVASQQSIKAYVLAQVGTADTLQEVTDNGATTTNSITVAGLTTSGNITLNGDSDKIILGAGGDGEIYVDTDNLIISNTTSDKDIIFNGLDNGSDITALTLDMSSGGMATFSNSIVATFDLKIGDNRYIGSASDPDAIRIAANGLATFTTGLAGELTGNASTATILATARNIGGVSFNGSSNINLPGVNTAGNQNTSGNAATATLAADATTLATARTIGGVSFDGSANIDLPGVNTTGNQDTSGNAATSTKIASITNSDIVQLGGAQTLTGTKTLNSFKGTGSVTVTNILDEDNMASDSATALVTQQSVKAYVDASVPSENDTLQTVTERGATSNQAITLSNTFTVGVDDTGYDVKFFGATSGQYMLWDESADKLIVTGEIEATKFDGALEGNADTATILATARNIGGVSFNGSANIDLPGVNTAGNQDTSGNAATATKIASITNSNIVQLTDTQTLTNKTLTNPTLTTPVLGTPSSGDLSNCTGYPAGQLPSNIDATKIADGSVTNTEFQYINTLSSNAQTQLDSKLPKAGGTMTGNITMTNGTSIIGTELKIDCSQDLTLDAGGGDIILSDDDTIFGTISSSSGLQIRSRVNNADMFLRGVDGGVEFTALRLDMSAAGTATFSSDVLVSTGVVKISSDGANWATLTESSSGDFTIAAVDDIRLDSGGNDIVLRGASSSEFGRLTNSSQDFVIQNITSDKDILLKGNDGGATITALTLDISEAGKAIFNAGATFAGEVAMGTNKITGMGDPTSDQDAATKAYVDTQVGASDTLQEVTDNGASTTNSISTAGLTSSGIVDITIATDATDASGDTGALRTEGGASIAKKLYVGSTITGDLTGDVTGNADTATVLATARNIGGVSFNGSANIDLPGVNTSGNQDTSGNAATATKIASITNSDIVVLGGAQTLTGTKTLNSFKGTGSVTVTNILDEDNMASDSATALATQQSIKAYVDGATGESDTLQTVTSRGATSNVAITLSNDFTVGVDDTGHDVKFFGATSGQYMLWDQSADKLIVTGEIEATKFDGALEGNADTATILATARNIGGVSFNGSANIDLPGVNTSGNQDTSGNAATATKIASITNSDIVVLGGAQTLTGTKTLNSFKGTGSVTVTNILDEDNMASDSATALATQQSIKAYVDASHPAESDTLQTVTSRGATSNVAITLSNTFTVGVDDTGHDVKFFGDTASSYMLWDASEDRLEVGASASPKIRLYRSGTGQVWEQQIDSSGRFQLKEAASAGGTQYVRFQLDDSGEATLYNTLTVPNVTGDLTGDVTGNADTATILATARNIGGVSFNGSANIDLPGVNATGNQDTSGNAATATILATARNIGGVSFNGSANIDLPGVNTAGNQNTSGTAAEATILETARTIGGVSFNGSANIDLPGVNTAGNQDTSGNAATSTKIASITNSDIVQLGGAQTLTGTKTLNSFKGTGAVTVTNILDEDNMASDSATALVTQQSVKAYVDASIPSESDTLQTVTERGATSNQAITLSNTFTVGVDDTGYDVKFFGDDSGEYMFWDTSSARLEIKHTDESVGLEVYTNAAATTTQPQLKVGRSSSQYWGVYTDDRNAHLVHRQDETSGTMTTRFDQWDSNTSDTTGEWLWRFGNGSGGSMATSMTLTQAGLLTVSNVTGDLTGDVTGNADTATVLATARNIGGVSFNGSANIDLPGVNTSGNQDTSGNAATATILATARNIGGVSFNGSANIDLPGVNTAGNQDTSGNAATATKIASITNSDIVQLGGAQTLTGTKTLNSFKGTGSVTVTDIKDTDNFSDASDTSLATSESIKAYVDASVPSESDTLQTVTSRGATSNVAITLSNTFTVGVDDTGHDVKFFGATSGQYMLWDQSADKLIVTGEIEATKFDGALEGNADTATILATARNIGGVSFNGSANIDLPGVNTAGNQDTSGNAATATILATARNIGGVSFNGSANIDLPGVNTAGNQDTSGNAATSTKIASITNSDIVQLSTTTTQTGTKTFSGVVDITNTTDSSDATGDTGALRTEGGASIAKKLYVGTDASIGGSKIEVADDLKIQTVGQTFPYIHFDADAMTLLTAQGETLTLGDNVSVNGNLLIASNLQHVGDDNNEISFGTDTQDFRTGNGSRLDISDSGVRLGGANSRVTTILDEDNMASDSATALATQQSIRAYVTSQVGASDTLQEVTDNGASTTNSISTAGLTSSGVVDITNTTDASDATGDTGALRTEGGASIAKKLYVGTDLDVDGTTNLDAVDVDGDITMANNQQIFLGSANASDPALTFLADTDTGLRLHAAGSMRFVVGGADVISFNSSSFFPTNDGAVSLGLTGYRWSHVYTDALTSTGTITGNLTGDVTGDVTGNADTATKIASITNSNIVQLSTTTTQTGTKTFSGVVDITNTTDASDATGDTGALRTEGGASIAKKLYVGTSITTGNATLTSAELDISSGDFLLDVAGDITLDADGADIILSDAGTNFGRFKRDTSDFVIKSETNDKDILLKGVDNSSTITALQLDMSEAGKAIFNAGATFAGEVAMGSNKITGVTDPTSAQDAATKAYVDANAGGSPTLQDVTTNGATSNVAITLTNTLTVGVDDTGHNVKFFGATSGKYMEWDESADTLVVDGTLDVNGDADISGSLKFGATDTSANSTHYCLFKTTGASNVVNKTNGYAFNPSTDTLTLGGVLNIEGQAGTISTTSGDITLDSAADIVIDAAGGNIEFKDAGTLALTIDIDSTAGDAIFKDAGSTEIFRIDGSADSLLMATNKKIEFGDSGESIVGNGTSLTIASGADILLNPTGEVGIGINAPVTKLDVHHNPTGISQGSGGGEVVTFGAYGEEIAAGMLVYLSTAGVWTPADADAEVSTNPLLGISLTAAGGNVNVLIRGFYNVVADYLQGTFRVGQPCYVSEATGSVDFSIPSADGDFVRIVGYATTTSNVIYFNPSNDYIEIG